MTKQYDNFADLITFTRASTGTYLDSDGLLKTATTNTPRIEYDANGNRKGLLIEEARTNLALYSAEFDNAYWLKTANGTGVAPVVTANHDAAPDGNTTADRVQFDSGAAGNAQITSTGFSRTVGTAYTFSIWMRSLAGDVLVTMFSNSATQNVTVTPAWQRFTFTSTASLSSDTVRIAKRDVWGTTGTADLLLWGAQLEVGSFPTSYIPTAGAAASRAADVASIPTSAFGYNADKGTVVVDFSYSLNTSDTRAFALDEGADANVMSLNSNLAASAGPYFEVKTGGVTQAVLVGEVPSQNTSYSVAVVYNKDDFAQVVNGGIVRTDAGGDVPTVNKLNIGRRTNGSPLNGHIKSIQYYPRRLTNAQLQRLTS